MTKQEKKLARMAAKHLERCKQDLWVEIPPDYFVEILPKQDIVSIQYDDDDYSYRCHYLITFKDGKQVRGRLSFHDIKWMHKYDKLPWARDTYKQILPLQRQLCRVWRERKK